MLVQDYIREHGLQALQDNLKIQVVKHPTDPLVILNYHQLDTPKGDKVARECRGLVLEVGTWKLVARSFNRFFNLGEMAHEMKDFDWSSCTSTLKEDGSLILLYFYAGTWRANTRGSFAYDKVSKSEITWQELIWPLVDVSKLNPELTYVCELKTPINEVTLKAETHALFLLSAFKGEKELTESELNYLIWDYQLNMLFLANRRFSSEKEVWDFINSPGPLVEGIVIRDKNNMRWKAKTKRFWGLHHMMDNNGYEHDRIFPFIMDDRGDELFAYFPEIMEKYQGMRDKVLDEWEKLRAAFEATKDIVDQKEFAKVVVPMTKFNSLMFIMRKNKENTIADLERRWLASEDLIFKNLFK